MDQLSYLLKTQVVTFKKKCWSHGDWTYEICNHDCDYCNYYSRHCQLFQGNECQLLLEVQLLGFQNEYNLETRYNYGDDIAYCCCDGLCSGNKSSIQMSQCPPKCDIFFNVKLSACRYPCGCFVSTFDEAITNSPSVSSAGYNFSFIVNSIPSEVSI